MKSGKMGVPSKKKNSICKDLEAIKGGISSCIFILHAEQHAR